MRTMKTIQIFDDGFCKEFGIDHGQSDPFVIGLDIKENIALIHHKSTKYWSGIGESKTAPANLEIVYFESFDVGERISGGPKCIFLRGTKLLAEFPSTRATSKDTVNKIKEIINE